MSLIARLGHAVAVMAIGAGSLATPASSHHLAIPSGTRGHDVGAVSCLSTLPSGGDFGIVGTTAGRPFYRSGCLSAEYQWAAALPYRPQYYINLADPGHKSVHWGRGGPRRCLKQPKYDAGCAFDYGFQAAKSALRYARAAGSNGHGRWWLDVETDNTWGTSRAGIAANIAVISGAVQFLRRQPHLSAGTYTETQWWSIITHSTRQFANLPVWGGGAGTAKNARHNCRRHSITGGPALLAQWIAGGVDHDVAC